jgi:LysM repeat protein
MTSDAKIGLLLGLVFIFVIAFLINGLPQFRSDTDNKELTRNMVNFQDDPAGVADREREAQELLAWQTPPREGPAEQGQPSTTEDDGVRLIMPVPEDTPETQETPETSIDLGQLANLLIIEPKPEPEAAAPDDKEKKPVEPRIKAPQPAKTYVVQEGDSLGDIAKKCYGPEQGNKRVNVNRLFEANRSVLSSPDEIYVGQKLTVPPLPNTSANEKASPGILPTGLFDKVKSIGRKLRPTGQNKPKTGRWYEVKDGDSLWRIASDELGSGSRYKEIAKLNATTLHDENDLMVGMRLRLPSQ